MTFSKHIGEDVQRPHGIFFGRLYEPYIIQTFNNSASSQNLKREGLTICMDS